MERSANFNFDKKSKILVIYFILLIIVSVSFSFYKYIILKDFLFFTDPDTVPSGFEPVKNIIDKIWQMIY